MTGVYWAVILDVGPRQALRRISEFIHLATFTCKGLDHSNAADVLVHDGGDIRQAALDDPRDREQDLAHSHADPEQEGHRSHGQTSKRDRDREHEAERNDRNC